MPYKGPLADTVHQLVGGLRAGMGYCGAQDLNSYAKMHNSFVCQVLAYVKVILITYKLQKRLQTTHYNVLYTNRQRFDISVYFFDYVRITVM